MATTDINGIVFLEETDPISPFHTTINALQQGTSDIIAEIKPATEDTGYVTYTVSGASATYNQYRRIGNVVYLEGEFWSITEGTIFTLPVGVRPRRRLVQKIYRASGGSAALAGSGNLYIQPDGTAQIRGLSDAPTSSPGLSLNVTFITTDPFPA